MPTKKSSPTKRVTPPIPRRGDLNRLYDELLGLPNVVGCFVGHRRRKGRRTREVTIVACVSAKPQASYLKRADRIPQKLSWPITSKVLKKIGVDVQVASAGELHGVGLGVGDQISAVASPGSVPRQTLGTIGIALQHPRYGRVVTTAGHVLVGATPGETIFAPGHELEVSVRCTSQGPVLTAHAHKVAITADADYAILSPPPGIPVDNLYHDSQPLGDPYVPDTTDLNKSAYFLAPDRPRLTCLRGIQGRLTIGGLDLTDVLITDFCTNGGDSGGCLVTPGSRPMGLVEGGARLNNNLVSVFTSVAWPLIREQANTF